MKLKNKIWRIIDIINWSKEYFEKNNIDSPRLTIELLLKHVLGLDRIDLYTQFEKPINEGELHTLKEMIQLRAKRVPLQYILGSVEFYGMNYIVNENVLIPRPETEEIVDLIIKSYDTQSKLRILDIGTGSGCIAISLGKHFINSEVYAIDNSTSALKVAKQNSLDLGVENVKFAYADILSTSPKLKYDIIVSNPPYVSINEMDEIEPELNYEPKSALTDSLDGLKFYRRFVTIFDDILSINGRFYLELNSTSSKVISNLFKDKYKVEVIKDLSDNPRILKGELS